MISDLNVQSAVRSPGNVPTNHTLADAAQQFEAILLQEILKPMQPGANGWDAQAEDSDREDTLTSFGTEAVATSIAKSGGLGIARQVMKEVTHDMHGAT
jgi:flagellar protein FlgJ